jgi:uncharacterized protein YacL
MNFDLILIRAVLVALSIGIAWVLRPADSAVGSIICGLIVGAIILACEMRLRTLPLKSIFGGTLGLVCGLVASALVGYLIAAQTSTGLSGEIKSYATLALTVSMGYIGLMVGASKGDIRELFGSMLVAAASPAVARPLHLVLDTSVIIDGRVADVAETGFLGGRLVIPQFVLRELQQVADSADSMKRNRGRRGLDILQRIQKNQALDIMITDVDFAEVREVDLKLIELAKQMDAKIVTNDFNLNKVAQLRGVTVLNINELANALRPVVLPGETMRVFILKEGKEYNQGVAYLDDGTMVVVDNARRCIGRTVDINVTSVLQTTAGKMIFGKFLEEVGGQKNNNNGGGMDRSERPERVDRMDRSERPERVDRMDRSERPERLNAPRPIAPTTRTE